MGVQTLLSASLGSLYNVFIDFSLGMADDTSASARAKKHTSLIPIAHNKLRTCEGMCVGTCVHTHIVYACVHASHMSWGCQDGTCLFQDKEICFRELQRTTKHQMKSFISRLPSTKTRQLGRADKRCIDIGSDTRVAAVHIMSFTWGCCERGLCQTQARLAMSFLPVGKCGVKQCLSFALKQ